MAKPKKKLTSAQKAAKKKRQLEYMTVFMNGKQKRVKRPVNIDGMDVDEFIRNNADPIWLHQNEMWEDIDPFDGDCVYTVSERDHSNEQDLDGLDIPF
jgi:hypothetical protein